VDHIKRFPAEIGLHPKNKMEDIGDHRKTLDVLILELG
jgi:hypothetical protein